LGSIPCKRRLGFYRVFVLGISPKNREAAPLITVTALEKKKEKKMKIPRRAHMSALTLPLLSVLRRGTHASSAGVHPRLPRHVPFIVA
jgi:hypothetical protein